MRNHLVIPQADHHAAGLCGRIRPEDHLVLAYLPRLAGNSKRAPHSHQRDFTLIVLQHLADELPCAIDPAMSRKGKTEKASKILHRLEAANALDLIHGKGNRLYFRLAPQFRQNDGTGNVKSTEPETSNRRFPIEPEYNEPEEIEQLEKSVCCNSVTHSERGNQSRPTDRPKDSENQETEEEFLQRLERQFPNHDVQGELTNFHRVCRRNGSSPNQRSFEGWMRKCSPSIRTPGKDPRDTEGLSALDIAAQFPTKYEPPPGWRELLLEHAQNPEDIPLTWPECNSRLQRYAVEFHRDKQKC